MNIKILYEPPPIIVPKLALKGDNRKDCCRHVENLEHWFVDIPAGSTCLRCKKCGCRHFELDVAPGAWGMKGR